MNTRIGMSKEVRTQWRLTFLHSFYVSISLSICLFVHLSVCLFVFYLSFYLSVCLSAYKFVCLFVCLSV